MLKNHSTHSWFRYMCRWVSQTFHNVMMHPLEPRQQVEWSRFTSVAIMKCRTSINLVEKKGRSNKAKTKAEILLMKEIPNNQLNMKNLPFFIGFHNSYNRWLALVFLPSTWSVSSQPSPSRSSKAINASAYQVFNDDPRLVTWGNLWGIGVDVRN